MSFVGGGSDFPSFYRRFGGAVLSTSISKYIYVNVNRKFDDGIRVAYSKTEEVETVDEIQHVLVRACLNFLDIRGGIEITTIADIPSRGTGLGSSSSFTIALLHALYSYKDMFVSAEKLAADGCHIELSICKEPIGKQDQYAAASGGFNLIEFREDDSVKITPVITKREIMQQLESNLLLLYTGKTRSASAILRQQELGIRADKTKLLALKKMTQLAHTLYGELQGGHLDSFGRILHENWLLKKSLAKGISTSDIDEWYEVGRRNGATGGKILGAGAGGFLLFYAPQERHAGICKALSLLKPVEVKFERDGSRVIFYQKQ